MATLKHFQDLFNDFSSKAPMKIYNHDITHYTHDLAPGNQLYAGRALGLTVPKDKIQLPEELMSEWEAISAHYAQAGINHTQDIIWNTSFSEMERYPSYEASVYFFGDVINEHDRYRQLFQKWDARCCEVIEYINSKNNFIQVAEELGIPVPKTLRFETLSAAMACDQIPFPCYVKPAVSDHGFGIMRCPDLETLEKAFAQLTPNEPLQIQKEVIASSFLNLQYEMTASGAQPLLVSEQILEGPIHRGNRYPSRHEPWHEIAPFAQWISDRGMRGIFAVDVAVLTDPEETPYVAIECNPRFNGSSYPTIIAKRLGIPAWMSVTYKTPLRSLSDFGTGDLTFDASTGKGIILVNWGTIQVGKIAILIAGTEAEQAEIDQILKDRLRVD